MALLIINRKDYSNKLKGFALQCKACGSNNIELEVDWAAYPSDSWCRITTICKHCHAEEEIYTT